VIDDQELVLYIYRDGLSEARMRSIDKALETDAGLRHRLDKLNRELNQLTPARSTASAAAHRRWSVALNDAVARDVVESDSAGHDGRAGFRLFGVEIARKLFPPPALLAAGPMLAVGVVIGLHLSEVGVVGESGRPDRTMRVAAKATPDPAVANAMSAYLAETGRQLVRLDTLDASERDALVGEIRARNRLYVKVAEDARWPELARVLRAFGITLEGLGEAAGASSSREELRAQLSFELNALQTRIAPRSSRQTHSI